MLVSAKWIREHQHDLDNFVPRIELIRPGSKDTIGEGTMKAKQCPECSSPDVANNRRVWHKDKSGNRVPVMQMRCKDCGRLFIPKE